MDVCKVLNEIRIVVYIAGVVSIVNYCRDRGSNQSSVYFDHEQQIFPVVSNRHVP